MLYFAYGSNINQNHMLRRCPTHAYIGTGYLSNFALYFGGTSLYWDGGAFAAVKQQRDGVVWGVLYELSNKEFTALDRIENVPHDYLRILVTVTDSLGMDISAFIYMAAEVPVGHPSPEYLWTIRQGAHAAGLPLCYIEEFFGDARLIGTAALRFTSGVLSNRNE
jgi:gamma-glutamylcyclotransferase (GGCT)/AIG2-like uncharacterized protein YtfP